MANHPMHPLKRLLVDNRIPQADLARGIAKTTSFVSQLANCGTGASQETIAAILAYLSRRLGRSVTYEEAFVGQVVPDRGAA